MRRGEEFKRKSVRGVEVRSDEELKGRGSEKQ